MEATATMSSVDHRLEQLLDSLAVRRSSLSSLCKMNQSILEEMEKTKKEQVEKLDEIIREARNRAREANTEVSATDDDLFVVNNIAEKVRKGETLKVSDMEAIKKVEERMRENTILFEGSPPPEAEDRNTENNLPSTSDEPLAERIMNSPPKWHIKLETTLTCDLDGSKY